MSWKWAGIAAAGVGAFCAAYMGVLFVDAYVVDLYALQQAAQRTVRDAWREWHCRRIADADRVAILEARRVRDVLTAVQKATSFLRCACDKQPYVTLIGSTALAAYLGDASWMAGDAGRDLDVLVVLHDTPYETDVAALLLHARATLDAAGCVFADVHIQEANADDDAAANADADAFLGAKGRYGYHTYISHVLTFVGMQREGGVPENVQLVLCNWPQGRRDDGAQQQDPRAMASTITDTKVSCAVRSSNDMEFLVPRGHGQALRTDRTFWESDVVVPFPAQRRAKYASRGFGFRTVSAAAMRDDPLDARHVCDRPLA